jgi:hypothetical protein
MSTERDTQRPEIGGYNSEQEEHDRCRVQSRRSPSCPHSSALYSADRHR